MRLLSAPSHGTTPARRTRSGLVVVAVVCALALVVGGVGATTAIGAPTLRDKQAQAAELDRQVGALEERYGGLQEKWRGAMVELEQLRRELAEARRELEVAKADLDVAQSRLQTRAVAIYQDGSQSTRMVDVARAGSFSEMFERIETIERVGEQDADILAEVRVLTEKVEREQRRIRTARDRQAKVVRDAAAAKRKMARTLEQKQAALGAVTAEIRNIMARQRAAAAAREAQASQGRATTIAAGGTPADAVVGDADGASSGDGSGGADDGGSTIALPPASGSASAAAGIAMGKIGAPYSYGAAGPDSFDCSGLVVWAFAQAGRPGMPHSSYALMGMGAEVPMGQAQVGDLIFTDNAGHVGIYVGGGSMVHSPREGRTVSVEPLTYYNVVSVRRT